METKSTVQGKQTKQVIFKLGNEEYGLDIMLVNAIEKYVDLVRIPNAPSYIQGIISLRGEIIPVFSLRKKFGLPEKEVDSNTKLIVMKSHDILMAYEVDEVKEILEISLSDISETPTIVKGPDTAYMKAVANINGRMLVLLDHNGIVSENEKAHIESFIANQ